jgi:hypothetical protein
VHISRIAASSCPATPSQSETRAREYICRCGFTSLKIRAVNNVTGALASARAVLAQIHPDVTLRILIRPPSIEMSSLSILRLARLS